MSSSVKEEGVRTSLERRVLKERGEREGSEPEKREGEGEEVSEGLSLWVEVVVMC